jgi:hydrogenase small subunit
MSKTDVKTYPAVWFQASACSGCAVAVLNAAGPTAKNLIVDQLLPGAHVSLRFHPTVMAAAGEMALEILQSTAEVEGGYLLVVDGAIPTADGGLYGTLGEDGDRPITMQQKLIALAQTAWAVVSVGTCSSFGGIHAAAPNPSGCVSVEAALAEAGIEKPLIHVPGCPPHPDWFVGTVAQVLLSGMPELDEFRRPKTFYGECIHDNCQRRGDFEAGKFARAIGEPGCLYELGCKGPFTHADCALREFNNGGNWCVRAGSPCHACVEPAFPDVACPIYHKIPSESLPRVVRAADGSMQVVMRPAAEVSGS